MKLFMLLIGVIFIAVGLTYGSKIKGATYPMLTTTATISNLLIGIFFISASL